MAKNLPRLTVLIVLTAILLSAFFARADGPAAVPTGKLLTSGELIATEVSKVTGCAISPILGISVLGAYTYYTTPAGERGSLPWHASPRFWMPLLVVLLGIILKDSAKVALPKVIMIPLDAAETLLEKNASAVLALIVLVTSITGRGLDQLQLSVPTPAVLLPASAHAAAGQQATAATAGVLELGLLSLLLVLVFVVVWVVSQAFNVLILLCPLSSIDLLLTLAKNALLALLAGALLLHPLAGLFVSLLIILVSFLLFSWSFRFVVFGSLMSLDLLRGQVSPISPAADDVQAFACRNLPGVPAMSLGRLGRGGSNLVFSYRPWLLMPVRKVSLRDTLGGYCLGRGRLSPLLIREDPTTGKHATLCRFRPRYRGREGEIAGILGLKDTYDCSSDSRGRSGLCWLREQFSG